MGRVPPALLRHRITVEPATATWGTYGPARAVRCFLDEKIATSAAMGTTAAGGERITRFTAIADPDEVLPEGSKVTLGDGRVGYIVASARHDGGGLPTPDHVEAEIAVGSTYGPAFGETVVVLRRTLLPTVDRYGNDRYAVTEVPVPGCAVRVVSSQETLGADARDRVTDTLEVLMPPGTVVTAVDRLRIRGLVYEVDGAPDPQESSTTGVAAGVRVTARRLNG